MSEERATYGEEQPDITDDNWKLVELERLLADKEKELQRARTAINNLLTYDTCKEHREKIGTENWVNVYKERQAFGCVYCTKEKVEEAEEKAKKLEAEMAAFRETFRINEAYAAEKANKVDEQGLRLSEQARQIRGLEAKLAEAQASCAAMRKVLDEVQELEIVEHRPACSDYNRVTISCECGYRDWLAKAEEADTTDAGKAMLERMELLEELVLLTARVGDWVHADRTPSNEELRRAIETVKGMLKEVSDASAD